MAQAAQRSNGQWQIPRYTLAETSSKGICSGTCPVCREMWAADPHCHCACTRPRKGDAAEAMQANAHAVSVRKAAERRKRLEAAERVLRSPYLPNRGRRI